MCIDKSPSSPSNQEGSVTDMDPRRDAGRRRLPTILVAVAVVGLVALVVALHVTGVLGPNAH